MVKMVEMDSAISFGRQLAQPGDGEIVLVNLFHVAPEDEQDFLELWREDARFMLNNGCVSGQLHKGVHGSNSYLNIAIWRSSEEVARAFMSPEFQSTIARYPASCTASPHIFKRVAVEGVCAA